MGYDLEMSEEVGEGNEHQSDHTVILFLMNLKSVTILNNKESYNYDKADFSAMIIFMRSVNWKDRLCGDIMVYDYKYIGDQCRKHFVPKMRKINLHGWITEHIKHKRQNTTVTTNIKGNHLMRIVKTIRRH